MIFFIGPFQGLWSGGYLILRALPGVLDFVLSGHTSNVIILFAHIYRVLKGQYQIAQDEVLRLIKDYTQALKGRKKKWIGD